MKQHRLVFLLASAGWVLIAATQAFAQAGSQGTPRGTAAVEASAGYAGFLDESTLHNLVAGGAGRYRLTGRIWVGGEVFHMWGPDEGRGWLIMPAVTIDLRSGGGVVPYLVAAAGWLRNTEMVGTGPYSSTSATVGGGGGVRFDAGARGYVAVEGRLGTEPLTRATVSVGWRLR